MFRRRIYRFLTTLVTLCAVAGAAAIQSLAGGACAQAASRPSCGAQPNACCCGSATEAAAACHCRGDSNEPTPPAPATEGAPRVLKAAPWIGVTICADCGAPPASALLANSRSFLSPAGRSLQSLLCIWRT